MATSQYIGARYVPLFADPVEWNAERTYEPLTIVLHEGNSYTSRQFVPQGIGIDNDNFWALTGNYNSQVEEYRKEVLHYAAQVNGVPAALNAEIDRAKAAEGKLSEDLTAEVTRATGAENKLTEDLNAESARATASEKILQASITDVKNKLLVHHYSVYKTPEDFGAVGDGIANDTTAIKKCLESGVPIYLKNKYKVTDMIRVPANVDIYLVGPGEIIVDEWNPTEEQTYSVIHAVSKRNKIYIDGLTFTVTVDGIIYGWDNEQDTFIPIRLTADTCVIKNVKILTQATTGSRSCAYINSRITDISNCDMNNQSNGNAGSALIVVPENESNSFCNITNSTFVNTAHDECVFVVSTKGLNYCYIDNCYIEAQTAAHESSFTKVIPVLTTSNYATVTNSEIKCNNKFVYTACRTSVEQEVESNAIYRGVKITGNVNSVFDLLTSSTNDKYFNGKIYVCECNINCSQAHNIFTNSYNITLINSDIHIPANALIWDSVFSSTKVDSMYIDNCRIFQNRDIVAALPYEKGHSIVMKNCKTVQNMQKLLFFTTAGYKDSKETANQLVYENCIESLTLNG